ncbi:hypothetical protein N9B94_00120 [Verrucomicrobia bacterium]|nr:hypothetical protein [Verrucomicrobiota bacterium]
MNPNRILPDLQSTLVCEQVRREANGNFFLIGVLGVITTPVVPITAPMISIFSRWNRGRGEFLEQIRIIDVDGTTELIKCETQFSLPDPAHPSSTVTTLSNFEFKQQGVYQIEVSVDGVIKSRFPLPVVVISQQGQPAPAAEPAEEPTEEKPNSETPSE